MKSITDYTTKELQEELSKREGVQSIMIEPYQPYRIITPYNTIDDTGSAIVTINID